MDRWKKLCNLTAHSMKIEKERMPGKALLKSGEIESWRRREWKVGCWSPPARDSGYWYYRTQITGRRAFGLQVPFAANPPTSYLVNSSSIIMAGRKTLLAPIHFIFSLLQKRSTVSIWLYEQLAFRIEGKIRVSSEKLNPLLLRRTPG